VVDQIGTDKFNGIVADALDEFLPTDGNYIGVNAFGGVNGGSTTYEIVNYATTERDYTDISSSVINLGSNSAIDYTKNYGNVVSDAMGLAEADLTDTSRQRYHVIFSSGLPLANGFGDATDPDNLNNPCTAAISAKQAGIQTYVVLIGDEEQNAFPGYYSCIVEDPDNDIFVINPDSPDYTDLKSALCKNEPDGYDIQITEVNPQASSTFDAFVEIYNRGAPTPIRACLGDSGDSGNTGCAPTSAEVGTGEYLVASNNAGEPGDVTSNLGTNTASSTTAWLARARVGSADYDSVDYDSSDVYPDGILDDRSYELRAIGFNNQYPTNWRLACYNVFGTPGAAPVEECAAYTNSDQSGGSCGLSEGSGFCNDITGANCNTADGDVCECPDAKLSDYDTCINMPVPTTCTGKLAKFNGVDYLFFQWDRVKFDGAVNYDISYLKQGGQGESSSGVSALGVSDYRTSLVSGGTFTTTFTAKYVSPIEDKTYSEDSGALGCTTTTLEPTTHPTSDPTKSPVEVPTSNPTPAPTQDLPGVFMKASGALSRENCFAEDRTCCTPFGPQFTDNADASEGATVPSGGCDVYRTDILELQDSKTEDIEHTITFEKYGEAEGATTTVGVYMYSYGLINMSDFATLNFTGNYLNDGIIGDYEVGVGMITTRRRRELLQSATPSPTYEYGNKLNIEVNPPGVSEDWSGDVVIDAADETDSLTINITTATLKCDDGELGCTTYDECTSQGLAYAIVTTDCSSNDFTDECVAMYPQVQFLAIRRSTALCGIIFGVGNEEDELPGWFWWVLIALIIFLLILAWLVYRFWWKQKKTAAELGDAEDELDQQVADNEAGFGKELDVGDVAFNPMATGVPGMNRPADAFGNELHQRQMEQQNDMVDVQAEIFQVRQDYGQVATGPRHHNQGGY